MGASIAVLASSPLEEDGVRTRDLAVAGPRSRDRNGASPSSSSSPAVGRSLARASIAASTPPPRSSFGIRSSLNDRIVIETDAPWCGIKASHPGHGFVRTTWPAKDKKKRASVDGGETVKDRSEPCHVAQVLEVIAAVKEEDADELAEIYRRNALRLFFPEEHAALG